MSPAFATNVLPYISANLLSPITANALSLPSVRWPGILSAGALVMSFEKKPRSRKDNAAADEQQVFRRRLSQARLGNRAALGELLEAVRPRLLAQARRTVSRSLAAKFDPADLVQETALEMHRSLGSFRGRTRGEFLAWGAQILTHKAISATRHYKLTRKREVRREVPLDGHANFASASSDGRAPQSADRDERWEAKLAAAVDKLPPRMREAFRLHYFELQSYAEIAARMQCSSEAARKLCSRAAKRLRQELKP